MHKIVGSVIFASGVFLAIFTWEGFADSEKAIVLMLIGIFTVVVGLRNNRAAE